MQVKLIGTAPLLPKVGVLAFVPDSIKEVLDLELLATELIDSIWFYTSQIEKNPASADKEALAKNLEVLNQVENKLKRAENLVTNSVLEAKNRLPAIYFALGKCLYLKAKTNYFLAGNNNAVKNLYSQSKQFYEKALKIFQEQKDYKGEILCREQIAIINDQVGSPSHSTDNSQMQVIKPLNNLCEEIPFKPSAYDSTFEAFNHFMGLVFGLFVASILPHSPQLEMGSKKTWTEKAKHISKESGLLLLKLASGYAFTWLFVNHLFVKPILKSLVKNLGYLPDFLIEPAYGFIKWAFEKEDLMEVFELLGNINHDLMKGYQKIGNSNLAAQHKRMATIYFTKYIEELEKENPANCTLLKQQLNSYADT